MMLCTEASESENYPNFEMGFFCECDESNDNADPRIPMAPQHPCSHRLTCSELSWRRLWHCS